jgi:hypothetical protein
VTAALIALIAWIVAHLTPAPAAMYPAAAPPPVVVEQLEEPPAVVEPPVVIDSTPPVVDPEGPATDSPMCPDDLVIDCR